MNSVVDFEKWSAGEKAWNTSCSKCHSSIDNTSKRGSSTVQIFRAIENIPSMKEISLNPEDAENIAYALKHLRPADTSIIGGRLGQKYICEDPSQRGLSSQNTPRHSYAEIVNVLGDLFGESLMTQISTEVAYLPTDTNRKAEEFLPVLSSEFFDAMVRISERLSELAINDSDFVSTYSSCTELISSECVTEFLHNFSARALKKPLSSESISELNNLFANDPDIDAKSLISLILLRPEFVLSIETGEEKEGRVRLDSYAVAARISFRTISSLPDAELWEAAKNDELQTLAQVENHVSRLIDSDRGKSEVKSFFRDWMMIEGEPSVAASDGFRGNLNVNTVHSSALNDFDRFIEYVVWESQGQFSDLFLDTTVFPDDRSLASIYGVAVWDGGPGLTSTSGHKGVLLRPATLMGGSNMTPIILRGVHVRQEILCDELPVPDQTVVDSRNEDQDPKDLDHQLFSNRDVVGNLTKREACMGCHSQINPIGFALEDFDSFGRFQFTERVFDLLNDELLAEHPISSLVEDPLIEPGAATSINGSDDLNRELASSDKARSCFATQITKRIYRRNTEDVDDCSVSDKESLVRSVNSSIRDVFVRNIANEDIFWKGLE